MRNEVNQKISWCSFGLLLLFPFSASASKQSPSELYPNRLITPDFGIVTADDLAYDSTMRFATPYSPEKSLLARYWQCVSVDTVTLKYNEDTDEDPMGASGIEVPMCDLEIQVRTTGGLHIYGDRRRHPQSFCLQLEKNWQRLTLNEKMVCFNGEDPSNENDQNLGKYRAWVWDKFKTHRGCYSYFGDCNVKGCATGKCPECEGMRD